MRLPLTVVSGYLGAGKTTLINRILAEDHGLNLMVMVNDFGAINIDQALIESRDDDVIALTNGCVCCTMGADLFMAIGDALDRRPRPDHLIVEASGIADPAAIANAAIAEPDLIYAGIVTLIDALAIADLVSDPLIAPQIEQQIRAADLTFLTKAPGLSGALQALFAERQLPIPASLGQRRVSDLLFDVVPKPGGRSGTTHAAYTAWHHRGDDVLALAALERKLADRPRHLFRLKGFVRTDAGVFEVQVAGKNTDLRPAVQGRQTALVGLGLAERLRLEEIEDWWRGA